MSGIFGGFFRERSLLLGTVIFSLGATGCLEIENPVDKASFQHRASIHFSVKYSNTAKVVWTTTYNDASGASKTVQIGTGGSFDYSGLALVGGNPTVHVITAYDPGNAKEKDTATITVTPACIDSACPGTGCLKGVCDRPADACTKARDDSLCSDGTVCNGVETCRDDGSCAAGTQLQCGDGNQCTRDSCDPAAGCVHTPEVNGTACDDGVYCDGADTCDGAGACIVHAGNPCAGGDVCNNTCNEQEKNCFSTASTLCRAASDTCDAAEHCDGFGACPNDAKAEGGTACDDGVFCDGPDSCDGIGGCTVHGGDPCASGAVCNNTCNELEKDCFSPQAVLCRPRAAICDIDDYCTGFGTCADDSFLADNTPCSDGNNCTVEDTCQAHYCTPGTPVACGPAPSQCFEAGICKPATGECYYAASPSTKSCSDGYSCTFLDKCDGSGNCRGTRDPTKCLINGKCYSGGARNPQNECHWCDVLSNGWSNIPDILGYSCNDGQKCTLNDTCSGGSCRGIQNPCANPPNGCYKAQGTCNPDDGNCGYTVDTGKSCSDGDQCTIHDSCDQNADCTAGPRITCLSDGNACNGGEQCSETAAGCISTGINPCTALGKQCKPYSNDAYECDGQNVTTIPGTASSNVYILSEAQMWPATTVLTPSLSGVYVTKLYNDEDQKLMAANPGSYIVSGVKKHFFRQIKAVSDNGSTIFVEFQPGSVPLTKGVTQVSSNTYDSPLVHSKFGRQGDDEWIPFSATSPKAARVTPNGTINMGYDANLYFKPEFKNATNIAPAGGSSAQEGTVTGIANQFSTWITGTLALTVFFDDSTPAGPFTVEIWNSSGGPNFQMIGKFPLVYDTVLKFKVRITRNVVSKGTVTWYFHFNDARQESSSTWPGSGQWNSTSEVTAGNITVEGPYAPKDMNMDIDVFAFAEAGLRFFYLASANVGVGPYADFNITPGDPSCAAGLTIGRRITTTGEYGLFGPTVTSYGPERTTVESTSSVQCLTPYYCDSDRDGEYSKEISGAGEIGHVGCSSQPGTDCNDSDSSICKYCDNVCDCVDKGCNNGVDRGCQAILTCPASTTTSIKDYFTWRFEHMYWDSNLRAGWYVGGEEDGYYRSYAQFRKDQCTRSDDGFMGTLDNSWTFGSMEFHGYVIEKSGSTSLVYKPRVQLHPMSNDLNRTWQQLYDDAGDGAIYNQSDNWVPFSLDPAWQHADLNSSASDYWWNNSIMTIGVQDPGDHDLRGSFSGISLDHTPYLKLQYSRSCH
jgi:hypothetical protein